jgi:hypothetical protein
MRPSLRIARGVVAYPPWGATQFADPNTRHGKRGRESRQGCTQKWVRLFLANRQDVSSLRLLANSFNGPSGPTFDQQNLCAIGARHYLDCRTLRDKTGYRR